MFLPETWTDDPERMARAGVLKDRQVALTKPEIAIEEIDRVIASDARFGCILADSGYGSSGPFRQALSERGLKWAVGLSRCQNIYPAETALIFPVAKTGKPRKYHIPDRPAVSAEAMLAGEKWRKVSWRQGTKGRLSCRFAACRVQLADGHRHRMHDGRVQAMLGDLIAQLDRPDVTAGVLATLDPAVSESIGRRAEDLSMSSAEFVTGAVREFLDSADDDLWFQLLTHIRKADDPGLVAVQTILRWVVTER